MHTHSYTHTHTHTMSIQVTLKKFHLLHMDVLLWCNQRTCTHTSKGLNRVWALRAKQRTSNWVFLNDNVSWVYGSVCVSSSIKQAYGHTETHMVVNSERIMGRVFLACCDWCLQGDKTDGRMGASAAQLTLSVGGMCLCMCFFLHKGDTMWLSTGLWQDGVCVCVHDILPLSVAVSSYSLVEGSAGTSGSMFMMRFLWLRELKLRLWPNWALKTET